MVLTWLNFLARIRLYRQRQKTRRQLAAMNDYMLKDLGISSCEVRREATKPFWRQ